MLFNFFSDPNVDVTDNLEDVVFLLMSLITVYSDKVSLDTTEKQSLYSHSVRDPSSPSLHQSPVRKNHLMKVN